MSYKYLDLTGLSHFWDKIKAKIPTKTSQLTNDSNFNYSVEKASGTIDDLAAFTSGKPGITGSISLTKKSSGIGSEIPAGWYNFFFSPHRTGNGGDNANYGTIIISPMTNSGKSWILRRSSSATTISEVKAIVTGNDLSDYVTLGTTQTITGAKTLNSTLTMSNINNATYTTSTTGNIIPSATGLANPPWNKDLWHDHFALLRYHTIESKEVTNDGTTWNTSTLNINSMFLGKDSASVTVLAASNLAFRFVLKNSTFAYSGVSWFELGVAYSNPFSSFEVLIEFSTDKSTWTTCHKSTIASNSAPFFLKNNTGFTSDGYIRVTFTKKTELTTGTVRVGCLKALCIRKGDQGLGSEYEYPYDWDINSNLLPIANNTKNLGSNNQKWANVYATTFNGNATSATKATQDEHGNNIANTYATHQDISGKVDKVSGKGLSTNDYTTTEKTKLSGIATGAEVNQNAFSNVKVGNTTIQADSKTDTLELVAGNNITLTPNSTNDSVTISATSGGGDNEAQLYNFVCSSVIPGGNNTNDIFVIDVDTDIRPNTFVYDSTATYTNVKLGFDSTLFEQCYWTDRINIRLVKNNTTLKEFGVYRKDSRDISVDYLNTWGVWEYGSNMIFNAIFDCSNSVVKILGQNLLHYDDVIEPMRELYNMVIGKQDKLSSQTAYSAKGTSTKVPQITTNNLGQVTNITEVDIEGSESLVAYSSIPIGGGCDYYGTVLPDGFMWADGSEISRTTYSELFATIGTTYGAGDGSTTFNLPDKRERVSVMKKEGGTFDTLGKTGGEEKHKLTNSELSSHGHQVRLWNKIGSTTPVRTFDSNGNQTTSSLGLQIANVNVSGVNSSTWVGSGIVAAQSGQGDQAGSADKAGGDQAHNNLQPYFVCNYIIRVLNISTTMSATTKDIAAVKSEILTELYPIGSIYMSVNNANPSTLFGGTWEQIQDRFLLAAGSTYAGGATGGEATHQLSANELPKLEGTANFADTINVLDTRTDGILGGTSGIFSRTSATTNQAIHNTGLSNYNHYKGLKVSFGNNQAHNNMPPYLTVYMWKRTA